MPRSWEQIHMLGSDKFGGAALAAGISHTPDKDDRAALVRLAHHQRRRRCDLIGKAKLARFELAVMEVGASAQIDQAWHPSDAYRDPGGAIAPGAAKAIDNDDGNVGPGALAQRVSDSAAARVGIDRQQQDRKSTRLNSSH